MSVLGAARLRGARNLPTGRSYFAAGAAVRAAVEAGALHAVSAAWPTISCARPRSSSAGRGSLGMLAAPLAS